VVLEAGDILYIPAHWFHYIVSLTTNAQCNTRSGTPDTYSDAINKCGFRTHVTEGA
jgi:ribosomal protein L16 Arg81 hydroxylase